MSCSSLTPGTVNTCDIFEGVIIRNTCSEDQCIKNGGRLHTIKLKTRKKGQVILFEMIT